MTYVFRTVRAIWPTAWFVKEAHGKRPPRRYPPCRYSSRRTQLRRPHSAVEGGPRTSAPTHLWTPRSSQHNLHPLTRPSSFSRSTMSPPPSSSNALLSSCTGSPAVFNRLLTRCVPDLVPRLARLPLSRKRYLCRSKAVQILSTHPCSDWITQLPPPSKVASVHFHPPLSKSCGCNASPPGSIDVVISTTQSLSASALYSSARSYRCRGRQPRMVRTACSTCFRNAEAVGRVRSPEESRT
jgi:hypothetical protein